MIKKENAAHRLLRQLGANGGYLGYLIIQPFALVNEYLALHYDFNGTGCIMR